MRCWHLNQDCHGSIDCPGTTNPALCDRLARDREWNSLSFDEQLSRMRSGRVDQKPADEIQQILPLVRSCPHRGTTLPPSVSEACGCAELTVCQLQRGKRPEGNVTLQDCVACQRDDRLIIRGHLNGFTGYGQHTAHIGMELERLGLMVVFEGITQVDDGFVPLADFVKQRVSNS